MTTHTLEQTQFIARPRSEVFAFFSEAENLQKLTPSFLGFEILSKGPIEMGQGTLIDYRIRLNGIPMKWRTLIEVYEPEERFVDLQLKGPYAYWHHLHEFVEVEGGTEMRDTVTYKLPLGPLGEMAHALFVRRQLKTIFDYRRAQVDALFSAKR